MPDVHYRQAIMRSFDEELNALRFAQGYGKFGLPVLRCDKNGFAYWEEDTRSPLLQKGGGWLACLEGGTQTGDDWAAVYIPVSEMPVTEFEEAQWSYYMTGTETFGVNIVIWVHDPTDQDKRAEITQIGNTSGLEKAAGWNAHEFNTATTQMFFYGEGTTGTDLTAGTQYTWDQFQADTLFSTWTIYRISIEYGWEASGTFDPVWVAEIKLNDITIPLKPSSEDLLYQATKSSGLLTSDTAVKASPGRVYSVTVSDTAAAVIQLNDSTDDSGSDKWGVTIPADGYAHFLFQPPLKFKTGIYLDVPTGAPDVYIEYV